MISGFYMALVLDRKYNFTGATRLFYQQRYLRLAPIYWVAVLITLAAAGVHTIMLHHRVPAGDRHRGAGAAGKQIRHDADKTIPL